MLSRRSGFEVCSRSYSAPQANHRPEIREMRVFRPAVALALGNFVSQVGTPVLSLPSAPGVSQLGTRRAFSGTKSIGKVSGLLMPPSLYTEFAARTAEWRGGRMSQSSGISGRYRAARAEGRGLSRNLVLSDPGLNLEEAISLRVAGSVGSIAARYWLSHALRLTALCLVRCHPKPPRR